MRTYCNLEEFNEVIFDYLELLKEYNESESIQLFDIPTDNEAFIKIVFTDLATSFMECMSFEVLHFSNDEEDEYLVIIDLLESRIESLKSKMLYHKEIEADLKELEKQAEITARKIDDIHILNDSLEKLEKAICSAETRESLSIPEKVELEKFYTLAVMFADKKSDYFLKLEKRYNDLGLC